jgi:hypothetical protein
VFLFQYLGVIVEGFLEAYRMSSRDIVAIEVVVRQGCARDEEINPAEDVLRDDYVVWLWAPRRVCDVQYCRVAEIQP